MQWHFITPASFQIPELRIWVVMSEDACHASACGVFLQPLPDNSGPRSQVKHGLRELLLARAEMMGIPGVKRVEAAALKIGARLLRRRGIYCRSDSRVLSGAFRDSTVFCMPFP